MTEADRRIPHKIMQDARDGNWDTWREHYDLLSINDLILINMGIDVFIREQVCKTHKAILMVLNEVDSNDLSVVELGCYRGSLANGVLKKNSKIKSWSGYDINYYAVDNPICEDGRYTSIKMTDWFYNIDFVLGANTFISTSTLEHHNREQFFKILNKLEKSQIEYIILGLPIDTRGWWGSSGSHVLDMGRVEITQALEDTGFEVFYNKRHRVYTWGARRR
jgi:hypothetical protein